MKDRQFVTPLLVRDGDATPLQRVPLDEHTFTEAQLQDLLFKHPQLIPVGEIEPIFDELQPLARELPVGGGYLDLVYINTAGYLTLVETKLWRNPEARRTVVAQIIDYATHLSAWSYDDLCQAVRRCLKAGATDPLVDLADADDDDHGDARTFIDRVTRNLRLGRFVLLIVGDGIHEGVERMADFLNQTPQLQFTLGLVEMGLYTVGDGTKTQDLFVQPRLVARTREMVRAVVEIETTVPPTAIKVSVPSAGTDQRPGRSKITENDFLDRLAPSSSPEVVAFAKWVLEQAPKHDLTITWGDAGPILQYEDPDTGHFTLGQLNWRGTLSSTKRLSGALDKHGLDAAIAQTYLDKLAALIPGTSRHTFRTSSGKQFEKVVISDGPKKGTPPPLAGLVPRAADWFEIIDDTSQQIREALAERDDA